MALVKIILNGNEVEYDDKEFKLKRDELGIAYLNYIGDGKNITNPKGNTSCRNMFDGCDYLKELDLSNFDTSKVTDMHYMFWDCSSLQSLDLSNFDTSEVTDMSDMFDFCSNLKTVLTNDDRIKEFGYSNAFSIEKLTRKGKINFRYNGKVFEQEIEYENSEWEIKKDYDGFKYLWYKGDGRKIILPKGIASCHRMFF